MGTVNSVQIGEDEHGKIFLLQDPHAALGVKLQRSLAFDTNMNRYFRHTGLARLAMSAEKGPSADQLKALIRHAVSSAHVLGVRSEGVTVPYEEIIDLTEDAFPVVNGEEHCIFKAGQRISIKKGGVTRNAEVVFINHAKRQMFVKRSGL